jgi:DNA primase
MKIYPQTNTFNCFGCGKNGDQIEFCTLKEGSKHKGLLKATELSGDVKPINNKPKQPNNQPKQNHNEILTKVFSYFQNGLNTGMAKKPKEYLQSRNLNHELLEIGYNSGQFHHRGGLSETDKQACVNAGLLILTMAPYQMQMYNLYSFCKDCIIFL